MRDATIFGTSDENLLRGTLVKDVDLALTKRALGHEQSCKSCGAKKCTTKDIHRVDIPSTYRVTQKITPA